MKRTGQSALFSVLLVISGWIGSPALGEKMTVHVMSPRGRVLTPLRALQVSNSGGRFPVTHDDAKGTFVFKKGDATVEYTPDDPDALRPNDYDIEVYSLESGDLVETASAYHRFGPGPRPVSKDTFEFEENIRPGIYAILGVIGLQKESAERVDLGALNLGKTYYKPEKELYDAIRKAEGLHVGYLGRDGAGEYEVVGARVETSPPASNQPAPPIVAVEFTKRYTVHVTRVVLTHVSGGEEPSDSVLLILPDRLDDVQLPAEARDAEVKKGFLKWAGGQLTDAALQAVFERGVKSAAMRTHMARAAASSLLVTAASDRESLFSADTLVDLGASVSLVLLKAPAPAAAVIEFFVAVVPPFIVADVEERKIREHADSDDVTFEAYGSFDPRERLQKGEGTLRIKNLGEPLYDVEVRVRGLLPNATQEFEDRIDCETIPKVVAGEEPLLKWKVETERSYYPFEHTVYLCVSYRACPMGRREHGGASSLCFRYHRPLELKPPSDMALEVVTDPPGATVFVNGREVPGAVSPLTQSVHPEDLVDDTVEVAVELAGYESASKRVGLEPDRPNRVEFLLEPVSPPSERGLLDVVFCIDVSGSMIDDIEAVQSSAGPILDGLEGYARDSNFSLQVGLVTYVREDEPDWVQADVLTEDVSSIRGYIQGIDITNPALGAKGNEDVYGAMVYAMNQRVGDRSLKKEKPPGMGWRSGAAKILVPIGDEPPDETRFKLKDVAAVAEALDPVHVYPIVLPKERFTSSDAAAAGMRAIADATGGEVVRVRSAADLPEALVSVVKLGVRRHREEVWRKTHPPYLLYSVYGAVGILVVLAVVLAGLSQRRRAAQARLRAAAPGARPDPTLTGESSLPPGDHNNGAR